MVLIVFIFVLLLVQCLPGYEQCADYMTCVPQTLLCDGVNNCQDGSDENLKRCGKCLTKHTLQNTK